MAIIQLGRVRMDHDNMDLDMDMDMDKHEFVHTLPSGR